MSSLPPPTEEECCLDYWGKMCATAEPVMSPPFSYDGNRGFLMNGIAPASEDDLKRFCKAKKHTETKVWLTTQLVLFGIPFEKSATKDVLAQRLKAAFRSRKYDGLCRLGASAEAIKTKLRQEYNAAIVVVKNKFFASIKGGPDVEVFADFDRFVAKYFLTTGLLGGAPDRNKTKDPLALRSVCFSQHLLEAVKGIPGLAIHRSHGWFLVGWDSELDRAVQLHFEKLADLPIGNGGGIIAQASFDFDKFALTYLHIDPTRNHEVTSEPSKRPTSAIVFPDLESFPHCNRLQELIVKTPGLCAKKFTHGWGRETMVVGWDAAMVDAEIRKLEDEDRLRKEEAAAAKKAEAAEEKAESERREAGRKAAWERLMKPHRELIAQQSSRPGPLTTADLVGSYIVVWEGEEGKQWGDPYSEYPRYESRLDVFPAKSTHGVRASFYFGLVEGTMLLATTRRSVELLREAQSKGRGKYCDGDDDDDEGEEDDDDPRTGEKRQLGSVVADPWGVEAAMAKRQKLNRAGPKPEVINNRAYFQFACNSVNGYPEVDDDNSHIGHFDFSTNKLSAKGQFYLPFYYGTDAPPQPLTLYKVSDTPSDKHRPLEWYMYDGRSWGRW